MRSKEVNDHPVLHADDLSNFATKSSFGDSEEDHHTSTLDMGSIGVIHVLLPAFSTYT